MPQAPRGEEDVVDARSRRMTAEPRAILVETAQVQLGQLAKRPERHIIAPRRRAPWKAQTGPLDREPDGARQQDVKAREIAADMPNPTLVMHSEKTKFGIALLSSHGAG